MVLDELQRAGRALTFAELTAGCRHPSEIVVHFLALLELYKHEHVELEQATTFGDAGRDRRPTCTARWPTCVDLRRATADVGMEESGGSRWSPTRPCARRSRRSCWSPPTRCPSTPSREVLEITAEDALALLPLAARLLRRRGPRLRAARGRRRLAPLHRPRRRALRRALRAGRPLQPPLAGGAGDAGDRGLPAAGDARPDLRHPRGRGRRRAALAGRSAAWSRRSAATRAPARPRASARPRCSSSRSGWRRSRTCRRSPRSRPAARRPPEPAPGGYKAARRELDALAAEGPA